MRHNPDNAPEKQAAYKEKLKAMDDDSLYKETKDKIWFSAFASNNPISCYHWQCDATYDEWVRRAMPDRYAQAHAQVMKANT